MPFWGQRAEPRGLRHLGSFALWPLGEVGQVEEKEVEVVSPYFQQCLTSVQVQLYDTAQWKEPYHGSGGR